LFYAARLLALHQGLREAGYVVGSPVASNALDSASL
jgi:hypothetical protein